MLGCDLAKTATVKINYLTSYFCPLGTGNCQHLHKIMCVIAQENMNTARKARETMNM